jgi:hypothetical protein
MCVELNEIILLVFTDTAPLGTVLLRWIKSHLKGLDFVNHLTEASQCFTDGRVLCALINR